MSPVDEKPRRRGRPRADLKRACVALAFEFQLPQCNGKREFARQMIAIDKPRFPFSVSSERAVRRDIAGSPIRDGIATAQRVYTTHSQREEGASYVELPDSIDRLRGSSVQKLRGWHWRTGQNGIEIGEKYFQLNQSALDSMLSGRPINRHVVIVFLPE